MSEEQGESFGTRLRRLREAAGLTQEALAERAGLTPNAVGLLERGERRRPYPHTVAALAAALGLSAGEQAALAGTLTGREKAASGRAAPMAAETVLPVPGTSLLGRDGDLAAVEELLRGARLVTLTGPGGVGKTRLALALAAAVEGRDPGGVAFVPLAPLADPALLLPAIADALGARDAGRVPLATAVRAALRGRRLLVLDNLEHLLAAASEIAALIEASPWLAVLATSRAPLRLRGEREYPLAPLAIPALDRIPTGAEVAAAPAARLFAARATEVSPSFALTDTNATAVAAICRRLDGLPLAIELAAARVRLLPPTALLARLDRALPLLTDGPRDLPARQRTMRDAIAWSHDLLSPDERAVFRRLAALAGGFRLEAAEAVAGDGIAGDVLGHVSTLVEQSLLRQADGADAAAADGAVRFEMLETIREYALEQLAEDDERTAVHAAHAAHFLDLAEEAEAHLRGPAQVAWLDLLDIEHANLRAALDWYRDRGETERALRLAGALGLFWQQRTHLTDGRRWLEGLLSDAPAAPDPMLAAVRAKAFSAAGSLAWLQGEYATAAERHEAARRLYADAGDVRGVAYSLNNLGVQAMDQLDVDRAAALLHDAVARYEAVGDAWGTAFVRLNLAVLALDGGDLAGAERLVSAALATWRRVGDPSQLGIALVHAGELAARLGDGARAEALLTEARDVLRRVGDRRGDAYAASLLGVLARRRGDLVAAGALHAEALASNRDLGARPGVALELERLAALLATAGRAAHAARLLGAAEALRHEVGADVVPVDRADREAAIAAALAALGEETFAAAWAAGRLLPFEEAIAEALGSAAATRPEASEPDG